MSTTNFETIALDHVTAAGGNADTVPAPDPACGAAYGAVCPPSPTVFGSFLAQTRQWADDLGQRVRDLADPAGGK